jgi:uncharacterized phage protein (TIGR01671 family)
MREIKFRAWDGDSMSFVYSDKPEDERFFEFDKGKLKAFVIVEKQGSDWYEPPEIGADELDDIDEFTGQKDTNGRDIYERDILSRLEFADTVDGIGVDPFIDYGVVVWMDGSWVVAWPMSDAFEIDLDEYGPETGMVTGNTYENPELLNNRDGNDRDKESG